MTHYNKLYKNTRRKRSKKKKKNNIKQNSLPSYLPCLHPCTHPHPQPLPISPPMYTCPSPHQDLSFSARFHFQPEVPFYHQAFHFVYTTYSIENLSFTSQHQHSHHQFKNIIITNEMFDWHPQLYPMMHMQICDLGKRKPPG